MEHQVKNTAKKSGGSGLRLSGSSRRGKKPNPATDLKLQKKLDPDPTFRKNWIRIRDAAVEDLLVKYIET